MRSDRLGALALVLALCLAYGPLVWAGFVWDDIPLVVQNLATHDLSLAPTWFQVDLWQTAGGVEEDSGYYRPLMLASLALDRALWGLSAAGHHVQSFVWHLLAVGGFLVLLRRLVPPGTAWLGAVVFALHPAQTEAVAWIAARNDLMAAAFLFASVAVLLPQKAGPGRVFAGGLLLLLGMLSKESAVLGPALLLLLDVARHGRPVGWARHGAGAAAVAIWFGLRSAADIQSASVPDGAQVAWLLTHIPQVGGHYLMKVFMPYPLSSGETAEYLGHSWSWLALGWLGGVPLAAFLVVRGRRLAAAGLVLSLVALGPAMLTVAVRGQLGERYLYLPIAGLALAIAAAVPDGPRVRRAALVVGLLGVVGIGLRVPDWRSDVTLWGAAVESHPNPYSWTSLGFAYLEADRPQDAADLFVRSVEHPVPYADACAPAVRTPLKLGDLQLAARAARATRGCSSEPRLAGLRAMALLQVGDFETARGIASAHPDTQDPRLPLVHGALWVEAGDAEALERLAQDMPDPVAFVGQAHALHAIADAARGTVSP